MPTREDANSRGQRRAWSLAFRIASELGTARRAANISLREVGRRTGVRHQVVSAIERGDAEFMSLDLMSRFAEVVGLQLAASLHPNADPVRDAGHLRLLARFRSRLQASLRWRPEVPIPIAGDLRSGDAVVAGGGWDALVEAETRLGDLQLLERRASAKQRDLGTDRLVLLVSDTRHNREVLRLHPELSERFPVGARTCIRRLARGEDPGGDAIVVL